VCEVSRTCLGDVEESFYACIMGSDKPCLMTTILWRYFGPAKGRKSVVEYCGSVATVLWSVVEMTTRKSL